jgi:RNAse (barnase) inhibitor barstar
MNNVDQLREKEQEERIRVLQFLMWAQVTVYAADSCEGISWFNRNQTKNLLKRTITQIEKEHGAAIKALWDVQDSDIMMGVTKAMDEFVHTIAEIPYWELTNLTQLVSNFKKDLELEEKLVKT